MLSAFWTHTRRPPTGTQPVAETTPPPEAPMPVPYGAAGSTPVWPAQEGCVMTPATGHGSRPVGAAVAPQPGARRTAAGDRRASAGGVNTLGRDGHGIAACGYRATRRGLRS